MENPNDYFDSLIKTQQQAFTALRDQALQIQSLYQSATATSNDPFASWSKEVLQAFTIGADGNLAKDTFSKTQFGTEAMQKLFELWQPLLNAIRDKTIDPTSYSNLTDPIKIKQLFDKLFNFDMDAITQLQKQTMHFAELYQKSGKSWTDAAKVQPGNFMHGDFTQNTLQPEALFEQMKAAVALFKNSTGKIFSVPALGKDRERIEQISKYAKALSTFSTKQIEYYQMMQATGHEAMQAVVKVVAKKVEAGDKFEKFDEFFALWIDTNEKAFHKLLQSKEFSQKRNAMTDAGFNTRKLYNEIIENQLVDLPIARRSEMDEVYKIIYNLRKQVKTLESQIQKLKI